jgi:DNA adenine methylase
MARTHCSPFIKWPGGKRWIADTIARIVVENLHGKYFEPFLGGGAVFFRTAPESAVLSDINPELMNVYKHVRQSPGALIEALQRLQVSSEKYREIRDSSPNTKIDQAVRFLYLNRTAFGGMYRLNRKGEFNVPYGGGERTPAPLWERNLLMASSNALRGAKLLACDFGVTLENAGAGDVAYCDPTYTVVHTNNGFVRYNESVFSWQDQERLAETALECSRRGTFVIVSNAYHKRIRELYPTAEALIVDRVSCMSRDPRHRRPVNEYVFLLKP